MKGFKFILILLFSYLFVNNINAQYTIKLNIAQLKNDTLLFGHYFSNSIMLQDTFFMDAEGKSVIKGSENLPAGMYAIFFPDRRRFDLLIDEDQEFSVSADTSDLLGSTHIKGSLDNEVFYDYLIMLDRMREKSMALRSQLRQVNNPSDSARLTGELSDINTNVEKYVEDIIKDYEGNFVSVFLKSMKQVDVPEPPRDENGSIIDSSFQAKYYKKHYFDYFDISDVRLLRTPLYENKLKTYLNKWVYPLPDSIYREVDWLIEQSRSDTLLFKYMLTTLFNHYATSKYVGMDAVYAYIGEKYYIPEASWSDPEFIANLKERIEKINPLVIGKTAPDVQLVRVGDDHFFAAAADTSLKRNPYVGSFFNLHDIKADYILIYFWEADCGHCKKSIPQLYDFWERMRKEDIYVEVIAVSMLGGIEGKEKWTDFINEHQLYGWINAWNPYDFSYKDAFDVASSNILYLLDKDKKIIAKRISPTQAEKLIENEESL